MNFITFDNNIPRPATHNSAPFVTVNARGKFNFSQGARRLLDLKEGDRVLLHQDKVYRSDWYLEITQESNGYKIAFGKTDSRFTAAPAARAILKSIGRSEDLKMSFPIATKQRVITGKTLWIIETKNDLK